MQAIVELALEVPGELRVIQVPGMDRKHVGVHWNRRVPQVDQDLDAAVIFACGEGQQGVVVKAQVRENFGELRGVWHRSIVLEPVNADSRKEN